MRPLGPDDDPLDVLVEMVQPDCYDCLERWQVACRLLKNAQRMANARIVTLEHMVQDLINAAQRQRPDQ